MTVSSEALSSRSWLEIPADTAPSQANESIEMAQMLERLVAEKIAAGKFRREDVQYVRDVSFLPLTQELDVSTARLEKLRRLCQLWEVDLKAPREISSHRKFVGPFIVAVKRLMFPIVRVFFKDTLRQQRDFNAAAIALLADVANQVK